MARRGPSNLGGRAVKHPAGEVRHSGRMHWRRVAGLGAVSIALAILLTVFGLPLVARAFVRVVVLILNGYVWLAMSLSAGMSLWGVLGAIGRATAGALTTSTAFVLLLALVAIGALALYGLQRLLGSEGEPLE